MHWPLMGPGGACALAGAAGAALLAVAGRGGLPQPRRKSVVAKRLLDMKLLNEDVRLRGELDELDKFGSRRKWPEAVNRILAEADKAAKERDAKARVVQADELLAAVKSELSTGASAETVRRRLRPRVFVFDWAVSQSPSPRPGGTKAQLDSLSSAVAVVIAAASKHDEAMLRLTSPGGAVAPYGLAAAQLQRLRDAGIPLTVCVDTVAASGGYMMACVANHIVAAPFATLGSVGVIAGVPNFHKVLERNEVEFQQITAGKYKRTINMLVPNTDEGLAKFREDIDIVHQAFKDHVKMCRPSLDVETIATGEVWLGRAALDKGLIDEVAVSDTVLRRKVEEGFDVVELSQAKDKKQGLAKLLEGFQSGGGDALARGIGDALQQGWGRFMAAVAAPMRPRLEAPGLQDGFHGRQ